MIETLLATSDITLFNLATLALRLTLGLVILPHGLQKLLGWFGGYGFSGTMAYFTKTVHVPYVAGLLAILIESLGALALMAGLLTRPVALGIAVVMLTATLLVHRPHGFFMNWFGNQSGEGYEYFILAAGIALVLMATGGGAWSIDYYLLSLAR